jgi:hypothetical protein
MPMNPSIKLLKQMGLPRQLCDLVYNMLDCVNGDLGGENAFSRISDVTLELQLMTEKPDIYLQDPGMSNLASAGFKMNDSLFMRDREYASLINAYQRSKAGFSELSVITGQSGVGKSYLVSRLSSFITADHGMFISVKFDQLKHSNPYAAIVSVFDDYCGIFLEASDVAQTELLGSMLREALGREDLCFFSQSNGAFSMMLQLIQRRSGTA